ncbi:MAG: putative toxin-antitoxin system toxin component, PIN family [Rhodocyclaceae bacterium]|jgi:putative PIN family toxin of toxin-antitoxin system|nr:putative toxin-antitoxin system toxin component, PIN family [Rhodocyclaceae bacterium]
MANSDTASNLILPRLVLDTNVVMDLFHFNAPPLAPLMAAIESGAVICLANDRTLTELARVTGYPQFKLDDAGRHRLYEAYRSRITLTGYAVPQGAPKLPKCRDPDDQMFLELALVSNANMLISRDNLVLKLAKARNRPCPFAILTPEQALQRLRDLHQP